MASFEQQRARMVEHQLRARGIGSPDVLRAMGEVPREAFVSEPLLEAAYDDGPLPIGQGQTVSQPYIVALMIEAAAVTGGARVLEIGAGSGYAAAVMSRIADEVHAIERHASLADAASRRLHDLGYDNVAVIVADGSGGLPEKAPFDAILVAAASDAVPEPLKRQLTVGGRLVVPVGGERAQSLLRVTRSSEEEWTEENLGAVRFVPLIGVYGR